MTFSHFKSGQLNPGSCKVFEAANLGYFFIHFESFMHGSPSFPKLSVIGSGT